MREVTWTTGTTLMMSHGLLMCVHAAPYDIETYSSMVFGFVAIDSGTSGQAVLECVLW
jgi:hypothetical protein